jgi:hypothetical protein
MKVAAATGNYPYRPPVPVQRTVWLYSLYVYVDTCIEKAETFYCAAECCGEPSEETGRRRTDRPALIRNICLGPGFFDWPEMIFNNRVTKTPLTAILLKKKTPAPSPPLHFPPRP